MRDKEEEKERLKRDIAKIKNEISSIRLQKRETRKN